MIVDQFEMRLVVAVVEVANGGGRMDAVAVVRMPARLAVAVAIVGHRGRAVAVFFGHV